MTVELTRKEWTEVMLYCVEFTRDNNDNLVCVPDALTTDVLDTMYEFWEDALYDIATEEEEETMRYPSETLSDWERNPGINRSLR